MRPGNATSPGRGLLTGTAQHRLELFDCPVDVFIADFIGGFVMDSINQRIAQLKELVSELRSDSFGEQYGIADFVEGNKKLEERASKLSSECVLYDNIRKLIESYGSPLPT